MSDKSLFWTDNPRHLRVLALLLQRPAKREQIDRTTGASNGPDLIRELRSRGLELKCERVKRLDRDGFPCRPGIYYLSNKDKGIVMRFLKRRESDNARS